MFVLIAGGGRTGSQLATFLLAQNYEVRLIEHRREVLSRLHRDLPTEVIYEGDEIDPLILEQAGIRQAKAVVACTTNDADNLIICFLARERYQVPRTIARTNNPRTAWLFDQKFHVDVALNQSQILSTLIEEEMSLDGVNVLLKLQRGHYSLVEQTIANGAKAIGYAIKDLALPQECVVAAIIRQGKVIVPRGNTTFQLGDEVLAVADHQGTEQLATLFTAPNGNGE